MEIKIPTPKIIEDDHGVLFVRGQLSLGDMEHVENGTYRRALFISMLRVEGENGSILGVETRLFALHSYQKIEGDDGDTFVADTLMFTNDTIVSFGSISTCDSLLIVERGEIEVDGGGGMGLFTSKGELLVAEKDKLVPIFMKPTSGLQESSTDSFFPLIPSRMFH